MSAISVYSTLKSNRGQLAFSPIETLDVFFDGVNVGVIKLDENTKGYRYWPKGAKIGGKSYPTLALCQESLAS